MVKNLPANTGNARDVGSIPGLGRSLGEGNGNPLQSREAAQMPAPATSKQGLGREARAASLRVRIGPECPEANQSEIIWASKPDCRIATTRKALRHCQAHAQNNGLNRTSRLQTIPLL